MDRIIKTVQRNVPDRAARYAIYADAIKAFEKEDCDTLSECEGTDEEFDAALAVSRSGVR